MRSLPARAWPFVLAAAVLGGWRAALWAQAPTAPPVIAPGAEVPGAAARGAADVAAAQKLARAGKVKEAVARFEKVAAEQPSVVHDCNLSLAYLRAGRLTEAQLLWDVSQLRGAPAPDWCGADLSAQLASALRDRRFVPLAIQVTPADATVELAPPGLRLRELSFVWLPPGTYTVVARRDGFADDTRKVLVAAPSATVSLTLADLSAPPPVDAAPAALPEVPPAPPSRTRWPAYVGAGVGLGGLAVGAIFHVRALDTKERADALTTGSQAFEDERSSFGRQRAFAIGGYALGAAGLGFAAYWWLAGSTSGDRPALGVTVGDDGAAVTVGGTWR